MTRAQALKIGLPSVLVTVGLATAAVADRSSHPPDSRASTATTTASASPAASPTESPTVTINGDAVELDKQGQATVSTGDNRTTIRKSNGQTTVTTVGPGSTNTTTTSNDGNLNVSVKSDSNNDSTNYSHSQVRINSHSSSSNSSSDKSTTITHGTTTSH